MIDRFFQLHAVFREDLQNSTQIYEAYVHLPEKSEQQQQKKFLNTLTIAPASGENIILAISSKAATTSLTGTGQFGFKSASNIYMKLARENLR